MALTCLIRQVWFIAHEKKKGNIRKQDMIGCYLAWILCSVCEWASIGYPMVSVEGRINDRTLPWQVRLCVLQGRGAEHVNPQANITETVEVKQSDGYARWHLFLVQYDNQYFGGWYCEINITRFGLSFFAINQKFKITRRLHSVPSYKCCFRQTHRVQDPRRWSTHFNYIFDFHNNRPVEHACN